MNLGLFLPQNELRRLFRDRSGIARIGKPLRVLTGLLRHGKQLAIRRQPLIERGLEAVQLAALLGRQAEAPALSDQLTAPIIRQAPRFLLSDPV